MQLLPLVGLVAGMVASGCHKEEPKAPPPPPPPLPFLVGASELKERLAIPNQVQLVDSRDDGAYAAGHIPGAISLPASSIAESGRHELDGATRARLAGRLGAAGLKRGLDIVVADESTAAGFGRAAFICWAIALSGVDRCRILDGGVGAWVGAGLALDNAAVTTLTYGDLPDIAEISSELATISTVRAATASAEPVLVDLRSMGAGPSLPGTTRLPIAGLFNPDGKLDRTRLTRAAEELGLFTEPGQVMVGGDLFEGSAGWFLLKRMLELRAVQLFPPGIEAWRADHALPGSELVPPPQESSPAS